MKERASQPWWTVSRSVSHSTLNYLGPPMIEKRKSDNENPTSVIGHRTSVIRHPTSDIGHRTSNLEHRTSVIRHQTSNIGHRTSVIRHPTSNIKHPITPPPKLPPNYSSPNFCLLLGRISSCTNPCLPCIRNDALRYLYNTRKRGRSLRVRVSHGPHT